MPFAVGDVDPERGYVHVLDDVTLDIALGELDTIADFTAYLDEKERLVRSGRLGGASGEEDLIAYYAQTMGADNSRHVIKVPERATVMYLDEGFWSGLKREPRYLAKKKLDKDSYLWDALIEQFNKHVAAGTLAAGNEIGIKGVEPALRIMAGEPRLARRLFAEAMFAKIRTTPVDRTSTRLMLTKQRPDAGYVFLLEPKRADEDYDAYRKRRIEKLEAYCHVAGHVQPQLVHIIGIATEPYGSHGSSEDLIYVDTTTWDLGTRRVARELHESGLFKNVRRVETRTEEFPDLARQARNRRKRERRERRRRG